MTCVQSSVILACWVAVTGRNIVVEITAWRHNAYLNQCSHVRKKRFGLIGWESTERLALLQVEVVLASRGILIACELRGVLVARRGLSCKPANQIEVQWTNRNAGILSLRQ